jgi:hypothetical protein
MATKNRSNIAAAFVSSLDSASRNKSMACSRLFLPSRKSRGGGQAGLLCVRWAFYLRMCCSDCRIYKVSTTHNDRDPIPLDSRPLDRKAQSIIDLSIVPNIILHSLTIDISSLYWFYYQYYYHYHLYRSGHFVFYFESGV